MSDKLDVEEQFEMICQHRKPSTKEHSEKQRKSLTGTKTHSFGVELRNPEQTREARCTMDHEEAEH